jgi:hypothetical protein
LHLLGKQGTRVHLHLKPKNKNGSDSFHSYPNIYLHASMIPFQNKGNCRVFGMHIYAKSKFSWAREQQRTDIECTNTKTQQAESKIK